MPNEPLPGDSEQPREQRLAGLVLGLLIGHGGAPEGYCEPIETRSTIVVEGGRPGSRPLEQWRAFCGSWGVLSRGAAHIAGRAG
jgi:hypothetical protein